MPSAPGKTDHETAGSTVSVSAARDNDAAPTATDRVWFGPLSLGLVMLATAAATASTPPVPLAALTNADRQLVQPVVERPTLRRQYPARTFRGRREEFEFLMDDMVACSILSEAIGLIRYRAEEERPGRALADDREGARGILQQVYCVEGQRIYYVEGVQRGLFQARGRGVVVVTFSQAGPDTIEYSGRMFVKIDNRVLATLAQAFFVFVKSTVDRHFDHVMAQPIHLSRLALDDPSALRACIEQMPLPDHCRLAPLLERLRR
jgi:hypothetical protein